MSYGTDDAWIDALTQRSAHDPEFGPAARHAAQSLGEAGVLRKVHELVRHALFNEYERTPIKRDHIVKQIIGRDASRAFPIILASAQHILRTTFGFELVEMRGRGAENPLLAEQAAELDQRAGAKRRRTEEEGRKATHAYVLRSTLPPDVRRIMTQPNDDDHDHDHGPPSLLDWDASEHELGTMGLLFVVLGIILVSGRQVPEARLRACLAQVSLSIDRVMPSSLQPLESGTGEHAEKHTLDMFLQRLLRQGYVERVRVASTTDAAATQHTNEWRWGPRAEVEIGEHAVAAFMADLYGCGTKTEPGSETTASFTQRIERAAGTRLVG